MKTYSLLYYDQNEVNADIAKHVSTNWKNSSQQMPETTLVPSPVSTNTSPGQFSITSSTRIHNQMHSENVVAKRIAKDIAKDLKLNIHVDNNPNASTGIIIKKISDAQRINNNPEGYVLTITNDSVTIEASNPTGAYYAFQSLRQLWNQGAMLTNQTIVDYPQYRYRGILLDTARHFFTVPQIKSLIDLIGANKLNTLHMHFSDDEGFRLPLKRFPIVNKTGDTRGFGQPIGPMMFPQNITNKSNLTYPYADSIYQGTYSAADIASIVEYANANQITVIPEIDLPGHARALIKAMPEALIDPDDISAFLSVQGYSDDVLPVCTYQSAAGKKFTETMDTIMQDVAALFNNQKTVYALENEVSVGGDEVSVNAWTKFKNNSQSCKGEWESMNALQKSHYFFKKLAQTNSTLKFSGWQQFVQNDDETLSKNRVPASQTGHVWVWNMSEPGIPQVVNLAKNNYPTVIAFADQTYFDLAYSPSIEELGFTWATSFSDTHAALSSAVSIQKAINQSGSFGGNIVGLEGALWSENIPSFEQLIYMTVPKITGLAEASWSPVTTTVNEGQVNWKSLATRLGCGQSGFLTYLNRLTGVPGIPGIPYHGYPNGIKLEASEVCRMVYRKRWIDS